MSLVRSLVAAVSLAVAALASAPAHAKCASYAEEVLMSEVVGAQPTLLVSVYAIDASRRESARFVLVGSDGAAIPLRTAAVHDGMKQRQIELVPERAVLPGSYRLRRVDVPAGASNEGHPIVVREASAVPARPLAAPRLGVIGAERHELGCGPAESIELSVVGAEGAALAFVMLDARGRGPIQSGYVPIVDGRIRLGHGMCSGPLLLEAGVTYVAVVGLIGADGRRGAMARVEATYAP